MRSMAFSRCQLVREGNANDIWLPDISLPVAVGPNTLEMQLQPALYILKGPAG